MSNFDVCQQIYENISKVIVGKQETIELLMVALLGEGHVLLEGNQVCFDVSHDSLTRFADLKTALIAARERGVPPGGAPTGSG